MTIIQTHMKIIQKLIDNTTTYENYTHTYANNTNT